MIRYQPFGIIGYASAIDHFLRSTPEYHDRFHDLGVQFVMPAAEMPPREDTIPMIEDVFNCPTIQEFGGVEFGQVAMKLSSDPWEVFPDLNVLEVEAETQSGVAATLVTTLYDRYLPLIRYKQGDVITGCETLDHGHVTSFTALRGRSNDNIELENGTVLSNITIWDIMKSEKGVTNFQFIIGKNGMTLRLIGRRENGREERILEKLSRLHSDLRHTRVEYVEDLETNKAGKRRWVVDKR
jgi:phenylacetate-coenzyme A ligase PaaK-like adenylate-forming protein